MRTIHIEEIIKNIKEMCIEANHFLSKDMDVAMKNAKMNGNNAQKQYLKNKYARPRTIAK